MRGPLSPPPLAPQSHLAAFFAARGERMPRSGDYGVRMGSERLFFFLGGFVENFCRVGLRVGRKYGIIYNS